MERILFVCWFFSLLGLGMLLAQSFGESQRKSKTIAKQSLTIDDLKSRLAFLEALKEGGCLELMRLAKRVGEALEHQQSDWGLYGEESKAALAEWKAFKLRPSQVVPGGRGVSLSDCPRCGQFRGHGHECDTTTGNPTTEAK